MHLHDLKVLQIRKSLVHLKERLIRQSPLVGFIKFWSLFPFL
jgi:hypothetical protein